MSAEGPEPRPGPGSRRLSLEDVLDRMKSVLRKTRSSPNLSLGSAIPSDHLTVQTVPHPLGSRPSMPPPADSPHTDLPIADPSFPLDPGNETVIGPDVISTGILPERVVLSYKVTRQQMWEQRARRILERFDMVMEPTLGPLGATDEPPVVVERVKKPIRMRVHRYCHRCERVFGPERICVGCEHRRCKKCPRNPRDTSSNKDDSEQRERNRERERERERERKNKAKSKEQHALSREPLLVIQYPRSGRQILVHNRMVQHVSRTCHKCQTEFTIPSTKTCAECGHIRCARCTGMPSRPGTWAPGYPGDAEASSEEEGQQRPFGHLRQERIFRKPRQRKRWNCDQCSTVFIQGQRICRQCGHEKCEQCKRHPPKKTRQDFDPEIVRTLNEKLSALVIATSAG